MWAAAQKEMVEGAELKGSSPSGPAPAVTASSPSQPQPAAAAATREFSMEEVKALPKGINPRSARAERGETKQVSTPSIGQLMKAGSNSTLSPRGPREKEKLVRITGDGRLSPQPQRSTMDRHSPERAKFGNRSQSVSALLHQSVDKKHLEDAKEKNQRKELCASPPSPTSPPYVPGSPTAPCIPETYEQYVSPVLVHVETFSQVLMYLFVCFFSLRKLEHYMKETMASAVSAAAQLNEQQVQPQSRKPHR